MAENLPKQPKLANTAMIGPKGPKLVRRGAKDEVKMPKVKYVTNFNVNSHTFFSSSQGVCKSWCVQKIKSLG